MAKEKNVDLRQEAETKMEKIVDKKQIALLQQMLFDDDHSELEARFMTDHARLQ